MKTRTIGIAYFCVLLVIVALGVTRAMCQQAGTGFGEVIPTPPPEAIGPLKTPIHDEVPEMRAVWTGCFQCVYVPDPDTGVIRKLERSEIHETTHGGRAGTGTYGVWFETYCELPGAPGYGYSMAEWPRPIPPPSVERLLGKQLTARFAKEDRARLTETYNLTGYPFHVVGGEGRIERALWMTVPAVIKDVRQSLPRKEEDTGLLGPRRLYKYDKPPTPLKETVPPATPRKHEKQALWPS